MTAQFYSCDFNTTPSRKRKRQFENSEEIKNAIPTTAAPISCFTNAAFCSTPKKIVAKRRSQLNKNKENNKVPCSVNPEATPIAEKNEEDTSEIPQNPFEVLRIPPKKKKRHTEELVCFENQALNLDIPEKLFNPYEVVREITANKNSNCFSNPALNLKVHDASILCNPFEVQRQAPNQESLRTEFKSFSKNPFIISPEAKEELTTQPCQLKLGLPFAPKLGCRIDFKDVSISQLTPSKLLAEKLVFSPVQKPRLSLDSIGEQSPMDIGNELDRYQLELENSINEAKLQKASATKEYMTLSPDSNCEIKFDCKQKSKFVQKLCVIPENVTNKQIFEEALKQTVCTFGLNTKKEQTANIFQSDIMAESIAFRCNLDKQYQKTETAEVVAVENLDDLYGCCADDKDDSIDFKTPAPFVRAYTKKETMKLTVSKKSVEPSKYGISDENGKKKLQNAKNIIRKSIRKLVQTPQRDQQENSDNNPNKELEQEKQKGLMNAIRSSFRKKTAKNHNKESEIIKNEISIIDCSERKLKLKTDVLHSEYVNVEDLTNERTSNLRCSLRKSSREIRNQFLKSVFHKHEEYDFRNHIRAHDIVKITDNVKYPMKNYTF